MSFVEVSGQVKDRKTKPLTKGKPTATLQLSCCGSTHTHMLLRAQVQHKKTSGCPREFKGNEGR